MILEETYRMGQPFDSCSGFPLNSCDRPTAFFFSCLIGNLVQIDKTLVERAITGIFFDGELVDLRCRY